MSLSWMTREYRQTNSSAGDLALVAGVFVLALTYLEVPFWNALLFGPAITLQAAVGVVVLTRLLKGVPGSLLLLAGPGLILGGALSFAAFQLVGRGMFGLLAVLALGVGAVVTLFKSTTWQSLSGSRLWTVGQALGLSALALAWEFPELLPVAVAFFVLGFVTSEVSRFPRWLAWVMGAIAAIAIAMAAIARQEYWWLVTDDYKFFEVISLHLTQAGPFADWGVANFGAYHWLSYGWSGLLNILGGTPQTFTTLTRVMPLVYAISLAMSLMFMTKNMKHGSQHSLLSLLPAWAIIAVNPLDWSGTSTAGVFSVLGAFIAVTLLCTKTCQGATRRTAVYLAFSPIVLLTKLPAVFTLLLVIVISEVTARSKQMHYSGKLILVSFTCLAAAGLIPLIWFTSNFLDGFAVAPINPGLGQLAEYGPVFAVASLFVQKLWLAVLLVVLGLNLIHRSFSAPAARLESVLTAFLPLFAFGIALDVVMVGNANVHTYFSGPSYFVSSLTLVSLSYSGADLTYSTTIKWRFVSAVTLLTVLGCLWSEFNLAVRIWMFMSPYSENLTDSSGALAGYLIGDGRFGVAVVAIIGIVVALALRHQLFSPLMIAASLVASLVTLGFFNYSQLMIRELNRVRSETEISSIYGSIEERDVGTWLSAHSQPEDLIATHHFRSSESGKLLSNFALGAWSQRQYFVLGPQFLGDIRELRDEIELCETFGLRPSANTALQLRKVGVKWFVVDKSVSQFSGWRTEWDVQFENNQFLVVSL